MVYVAYFLGLKADTGRLKSGNSYLWLELEWHFTFVFERDTGEAVYHWPSAHEFPAFWNLFIFYNWKWSFCGFIEENPITEFQGPNHFLLYVCFKCTSCFISSLFIKKKKKISFFQILIYFKYLTSAYIEIVFILGGFLENVQNSQTFPFYFHLETYCIACTYLLIWFFS